MPDTEEYGYLQTTAAIRARAREIHEAGRRGELAHFRIHDERLAEAAERVVRVTRAAYPDVRAIPYHGRYRHFDVGGVARLARFLRGVSELSADDQLRASTELVITSVLLDAGAGPAWRYTEPDGRSYARSEGLAVASYHLFMSGSLASDHGTSADAEGLARLDAAHLASAFQVTDDNPLTGVNGRANLLRELGRVVSSTPRYFDSARPRLGDLGVWLKSSARSGELPASAVLAAVLDALGPIWPGRERAGGRPLGDVWRHSSFGLVPFHKLSQWLSYSLLEPLEAAGVRIVAMEELTGLPEYRNGGLFLDAGVLELVEPRQAALEHEVSSDLVIEWRALTVALLDDLAAAVRERLGLTVEELPLARVLEGGSWRAGRAIAKELREDGGPPLRILSDGTVF
ncbi:MAG: putative pyrimidine-degrading protein [Polyangiaceae bacterium]|jgi:hypothetical protein|nr:putative pyrimidine-degrading protein [Polyangiaceae bacterium]